MAKKLKKKVPNPRKTILRTPGPVLSPQSSNHGEEIGVCNHYSRSKEDLNRVLLGVRTNLNNITACEHCRDEPDNRRGGKIKQPKKKGNAKGSESKKESSFIWVCLDCNRYFCGGEVSAIEPYGHARRHSKQEHHMWAVRADDPLISWCYSCSSSVPIEMPAEDMDLSSVGAAIDDENGVGESLAVDSGKGYVVRGLSNLGNTCFFNSVMQNLLATNLLYDYLVNLDRPYGPITMSLKKLFVETRSGVDSRNVIAPKVLFGSICAKASQFRGFQQQDSHELLRSLLAGLESEETSTRKLEDDTSEEGDSKVDKKPIVTFVEEIFGGYTSSTVCCTECGYTSIVHEQFLDLSLPLPSKKTPPKRAPPPPPKRRPALTYKNKGRIVKERVLIKEPPMIQNSKEESSSVKENPMIKNSKEESSSAPSECSESIVPEQKQKEILPVEDEYESSWMDFIGPGGQCSDTKEIQENGSFAQNILDLQLKDDVSCMNEASASTIQDANINKEPGVATEEISEKPSCSQTMENAEAEFDGFADLFDEPEVNSAPNTEKETCEELGFTLYAGNSSESIHDEVSVNTCLTLFTKPELLTGDQAWHCEQCSKNVKLMKVKEKVASILSKSKSDQSLNAVSGNSKEVIQNGGSPKLSDNSSSQYYSCQPADEEIDSCSNNNIERVQCDSTSEVNQLVDSNGKEEVTGEKNIKVMRDATKTILIDRTPQFLNIHLKRFKQDSRGRFSKLSGYVDFQETLDLRPYMDPRSEDYKKGKCHYRLTGVVMHSGSMSGGHYTCFVRGRRGGSKKSNAGSAFFASDTGSGWFYASDGYIREATLSEVLESEAYILFYERVSI